MFGRWVGTEREGAETKMNLEEYLIKNIERFASDLVGMKIVEQYLLYRQARDAETSGAWK